MAKPKGLKWAKNAFFNAFQFAKGGYLWYHAKASSCNDAAKISWNLVAGTSLASHVISNFATCVSGSEPVLPRKYGMCTILWILGAPGILAIITWGTSNGTCNGVKQL